MRNSPCSDRTHSLGCKRGSDITLFQFSKLLLSAYCLQDMTLKVIFDSDFLVTYYLLFLRSIAVTKLACARYLKLGRNWRLLGLHSREGHVYRNEGVLPFTSRLVLSLTSCTPATEICGGIRGEAVTSGVSHQQKVRGVLPWQ